MAALLWSLVLGSDQQVDSHGGFGKRRELTAMRLRVQGALQIPPGLLEALSFPLGTRVCPSGRRVPADHPAQEDDS